MPTEFGSNATVLRWFQRFLSDDGVFERLWAVLVDACDESGGLIGSGSRPITWPKGEAGRRP